MRNFAIAIFLSCLSVVGCAEPVPEMSQGRFDGFMVSKRPDESFIVVKPDSAGSVYINRGSEGSDTSNIGVGLFVIHPKSKFTVLEAIDTDGDGYWDIVRYSMRTKDGMTEVQDINGAQFRKPAEAVN